MSRPQLRATTSVSLFPFLAVLICAMGALIFLLIVTTERIRADAVAHAAEGRRLELEPPPADVEILEPDQALATPIQEPAAPVPNPEPEPEVVDPDDLLRDVAKELSEQRDRKRREEQERQSILLAAKRRLDETESALQESRRRLQEQAQMQERHNAEKQLFENQRASLVGQISKIKKELKDARRKVSRDSSKYAFIPFDGQTGTIRRPILIECSEDGLRFVPEGIVLTADDLEGFTRRYNPLLAGAQSLVAYWAAKSIRRGEPEPYVLLVVRPNGSVAFYAARAMLGNLRQPYGYELLEGNRTIDLPEPDPQAQAVCQEAIDRLLAERDDVREFVVSGRTRDGRTVRFYAGSGRFEVVDSDSPRSAGPNRIGNRFDAGNDNGRGLGNGGRGNRIDRNKDAGNGFPVPDGFSKEALNRSKKTRRLTTSRGTIDRPGDPKGTARNEGAARNGTASSPSPTGTSRRGESQSGPFVGAVSAGAGDAAETGSAGANGEVGIQDGSGIESEHTSAGPGRSGFGWQQDTSGGPRASQSAGMQGRSAGKLSNSSPSFGQPSTVQLNLGGGQGRRQSRRWGLSNRRAGIGFEREVTIWIEADRVVIGKRVIEANRNLDPKQLVDEVVQVIDDRARSWGPPPENFYWVPSIKFQIVPGGNLHYEQLNGPLQRLGLSTYVEYIATRSGGILSATKGAVSDR